MYRDETNKMTVIGSGTHIMKIGKKLKSRHFGKRNEKLYSAFQLLVKSFHLQNVYDLAIYITRNYYGKGKCCSSPPTLVSKSCIIGHT